MKLTGEQIRKYQERAVDVMRDSVAEKRDDGKVTPFVGAVLIKPDKKIETAYRGELREGDHAEFTVLERKNGSQKLGGSILFATLEPCAPGARHAPKLSCAERIVNARISEVYVGTRDPDPSVDGKGIKYLEEKGVTVYLFDRDLEKEIKEANKHFNLQAIERGERKREEEKERIDSSLLPKVERAVELADFNDFDDNALYAFQEKSKSEYGTKTDGFKRRLLRIGCLEKADDGIKPTGVGFLLFGKNIRDIFPQAAVKLKAKFGKTDPILEELNDAIVLLPEKVETWLIRMLHSATNREGFERTETTTYPIEPLREAIMNAIAHRDYNLNGAKVHVEIDDNKIEVRSPGAPYAPVTLQQLANFSAPSNARNPKITYVLNLMGVMEESHLGMDTFKAIGEKYDLPFPVFKYVEPNLIVTFPRSFESLYSISDEFKGLSIELLKGYNWIKGRRQISRSDYEKHFDIPDRTANNHLAELLKAKLIEKIGSGPKTAYIAKT